MKRRIKAPKGGGKSSSDNKLWSSESASPPSPSRTFFTGANIALLVLSGTVATLIYLNSLPNLMVWDDLEAVEYNKVVPKAEGLWTHDFWGDPMDSPESHKSWRPFTTWTYHLNHRSHGLKPWGYHVVNVAVHAAATVACHVLTWQISDVGTAFAASLLFAVHPIHTESINQIVGRADMLCALFMFVSISLFIASYRSAADTFWPGMVLSAACYAVSALSKESGLVTIGITLAYDLVRVYCAWKPERQRRGTIIGMCAARTAAFATVSWWMLSTRSEISGASTIPRIDWEDNPMQFVDSAPLRLLSYMSAHVEHFWVLAFPVVLRADYPSTVVTSIFSGRAAQALLLYAMFVLLAVAAIRSIERARTRAQARNSALDARDFALPFAAALLVLPFAPSTNFIAPVGFIVAERVMYPSSAGWCILLALAMRQATCASGASQTTPPKKTDTATSSRTGSIASGVAWAVVVICAAAMGFKVWHRNPHWKNNETLWKHEYEISGNTEYRTVRVLGQRSMSWVIGHEDKPHALDAQILAECADDMILIQGMHFRNLDIKRQVWRVANLYRQRGEGEKALDVLRRQADTLEKAYLDPNFSSMPATYHDSLYRKNKRRYPRGTCVPAIEEHIAVIQELMQPNPNRVDPTKAAEAWDRATRAIKYSAPEFGDINAKFYFALGYLCRQGVGTCDKLDGDAREAEARQLFATCASAAKKHQKSSSFRSQVYQWSQEAEQMVANCKSEAHGTKWDKTWRFNDYPKPARVV